MEQINEEKIKCLLEGGASSIGLTLYQKQKETLLAYLLLLEKWNKAYNLSAIRNREEMVGKHLLDSLSVLPILIHEKMSTLADVGSGAGLPGVPIAIMLPQLQVFLIDSNGKKAGFLRQVKTQLQLDNVTVLNARVESLQQTFDAAICRAFASTRDALQMAGPILDKNTTFWIMKGKYPAEELRELPKPYKVSASYPLNVSGCDGERHLLKIIHE